MTGDDFTDLRGAIDSDDDDSLYKECPFCGAQKITGDGIGLHLWTTHREEIETAAAIDSRKMMAHLREREDVARDQMNAAEDETTRKFWRGRLTFIANMIEFAEVGVFEDAE